MSRLTGFLAVFFLSLASLLAQRPTHPTDNTITIAQRLGYPPTSRLLIIHADDFGMMHTVDTATEEAFDNHWITSASILVPCPWFPEVAQWAKSHPDADLGIHLALNADWTSYRWSPVSPQPQDSSLLDPDGYLPLTTSYVVAHAKPADVQTEVHAQVDKALAAGIHISHLDTHMGTIVSSPVSPTSTWPPPNPTNSPLSSLATHVFMRCPRFRPMASFSTRSSALARRLEDPMARRIRENSPASCSGYLSTHRASRP